MERGLREEDTAGRLPVLSVLGSLAAFLPAAGLEVFWVLPPPLPPPLQNLTLTPKNLEGSGNSRV